MPSLFRHHPIAPLSCREFVELVTAYVEGALDAATLRRVEEHLAVCEPCRVYVEQMRAVKDGLRGAELPELPEDVCMELVAAFRGRRRRPGS